MRNDLVTVASGWVSDCAIADLVGDDPTDALVPTRAPTPELALVGALLAVAIGDLQRADPDARAWVAGAEPEPGPALSIEVVAEVLGIEVRGRDRRPPARRPGRACLGRRQRARPGPAFSVEFVAEVLGVEVEGLRARIMRAADLGSTPRRNPFGDTRRRRAA